MADEIDMAQPNVDAFTAASLAALQRVTAKGNGICKACGHHIEPERLAVKPDALLCIECAGEAEEFAKRRSLTGVR
jgi:RNA polymerase-binding transcription factor DksA